MLMDAYLHLFMDTYLWKRTGGYPYDLGNLYIGYIYGVDQVAAKQTSVHNSPTLAIENCSCGLNSLKWDEITPVTQVISL